MTNEWRYRLKCPWVTTFINWHFSVPNFGLISNHYLLNSLSSTQNLTKHAEFVALKCDHKMNSYLFGWCSRVVFRWFPSAMRIFRCVLMLGLCDNFTCIRDHHYSSFCITQAFISLLQVPHLVNDFELAGFCCTLILQNLWTRAQQSNVSMFI